MWAYHHGGEQKSIDRVVVHVTDSGEYPWCSMPETALGTIRYFTSPNSGGSAHVVCDTETTLRALPDNVVAYHAPPNENSIGVEIAGRAALTREQWLSPSCWPAVERGAAEVTAAAMRHNVPLVRLSPADLVARKRGICGHVDVSQAFRQSDHWDPGPGFPWDEFVARVAFYHRQYSHDYHPTNDPERSTVTLTAEESKLLKAAAESGKPLVFRDSGTGYAYVLQPQAPHLERVTKQDTINLMVSAGVWSTGNGTPEKLGTIATAAIRDLSGWVPNK